MGILLTIFFALYLIVVFLIMTQKKIDRLPPKQIKNNDEDAFAMDFEQSKKWIDYSVNLKSSPFLEGYDRPDM